jgi:hypothetical protein
VIPAEVNILKRLQQRFLEGEGRRAYTLPVVFAAYLIRSCRLDLANGHKSPRRRTQAEAQKICITFLTLHEKQRRVYRGERRPPDAHSWGDTPNRAAKKLRNKVFTDPETGATVRFKLWDEPELAGESSPGTFCLVPVIEWPHPAARPLERYELAAFVLGYCLNPNTLEALTHLGSGVTSGFAEDPDRAFEDIIRKQ